jgi:hypothetical protein
MPEALASQPHISLEPGTVRVVPGLSLERASAAAYASSEGIIKAGDDLDVLARPTLPNL